MTTKTQARAKGEAAGQRCVASTERDVPDWSEQAGHYLRWFCKIRRSILFPDPAWTCEQFRSWAYSKGLPFAKDDRAFGPIIAKAIRDGLIRSAGFAPTVSSHGAVRRTYVRCV
jgi:hypothetical protein